MTALVALVALALLGGSGLVGLLWPRGSVTGDRVATGVFSAGALFGIVAAGAVFVTGPAGLATPAGANLGPMSIRIDALSAMFLVQLFVIGAAGAVYADGYWSPREHPDSARRLRVAYGATAAGLGLVFLAGDLVVFLVGWEIMAIGAFFSITAEERDERIREAGRLYLFCTKASTLALMALCATWYRTTGSFALATADGAPTALFLLALLAFGLKAGAMPLHVWLPSAHGSAPSHVSAFLSGVLIKVGIYGLVRVLGLLPAAPPWWGHVVFAIGALSSVLGVVFAIGQHDLKRLLAYHSIENIGIILLGLGLALTGRAAGQPELAALGLAGALLHTWNHGLFKALLFLAAGSVLHGTGLRELDRLGGVARRLPYTSLAFLCGAVAICGLPPLNGFVSEFLLYMGLVRTLADPEAHRVWLMGGLGTPALALTGALALLCFAKVFGLAFLGEPRSELPVERHGEPRTMLVPMAGLVACCVAIGVLPIAFVPILDAAARTWWPGAPAIGGLAPLATISVFAILLVTLFVLSAYALSLWLAGAARTVTWDCGYAAPAPRMQYTATSFADSVVALFSWALVPVRHEEPVGPRPLPPAAHVESHVRDPALEVVLLPGASRIADAASRVHGWWRAQPHHGVLYVLVTLLSVLTLAWLP